MKTPGDKFAGVLWGTAVGDSLGLPAEGISREKIRMLGWEDNWKHRLIFGKGMLSDDTEHTLMVVQALLDHPSDVDAFRCAFAAKLRWWLLALPAGIGLATARAILKLWIGFSPTKSGVYSAGNGPAMRSAILGAYFAEDPEQLERFVQASTEVTHTDPKALVGALAVAYCAATPEDLELVWERLESLSKFDGEHWPELLTAVHGGIREKWEMEKFLSQMNLGRGVSGYVYHTVPVVIFAWFRWRDEGFERILTEVLNSGGDTDTTGAIVGAIAGANFGGQSIPELWKEGLVDWPISKKLIEKCVDCLNSNQPAPKIPPIFSLFRNLLFLVIVLCHGLLRLVPCWLRKAR